MGWCNYWAVPIGVVASICAILGFSLWGLVDTLADVKSKDAVIRNMEQQNSRLSLLLENREETILELKNEILRLQSLPNQDELRRNFLNQPHIKETDNGIHDEKNQAIYCSNCFQGNPMKLIRLCGYNLIDKRCPVCNSHYSSTVSPK